MTIEFRASIVVVLKIKTTILEQPMRLVLAGILLWGLIVRTIAQEPFGFDPNDRSGSVIKLEGLIVHQVSGGYLALSVPPKDIKRIVEMAEMLSPHTAGLKVLEILEKENQKLTPTSMPDAVPAGICFLATNEIFLRHKILDRNVHMVGTYTYLDLYGKPITVSAYSGGPSR